MVAVTAPPPFFFLIDVGVIGIVCPVPGQFLALLGDKLGYAQEGRGSQAPGVKGRGLGVGGLGRREEARDWSAADLSDRVAQNASGAPSQKET